VLRVLHPMIPFITEEIWQRLPHLRDSDHLMSAAWPMDTAKWGGRLLADPRMAEAEHDIERLIAVVTSHRMLKAESKISPAKPVEVLVRAVDPESRASLARIRELAEFVGRMQSLTLLGDDTQLPRQCSVAVVAGVEVGLPLAGLVDLDEERKRLAREIDKKTKELESLDRKLDNAGFLARAPAEVVAKEQLRQAELRDSLAKQQALLDRLGG
jgi:valyl-tRNA synthetase